MNWLLALAYRAAIVLILAFITLPLIVVLVASVSPTPAVTFDPTQWTLAWYRALLDRRWVDPFVLSFELAGIASLLSGVLGFAAAYAVVTLKCPGRTAIMAFLLSPLSVPQIVKGVAIVLFVSSAGLYDLLGTPALLIAHVVLTLPFVLRMSVSALNNFDTRLDRAARILGASPAQSLRHVMLPLVKGGIFSGVTLAFILSFNNIPLSIFLAQPGQTTLPITVVNYLEYSLDPVLAAVNVASMLFVLIAIALFQRIGGFSTNLHGGTK